MMSLGIEEYVEQQEEGRNSRVEAGMRTLSLHLVGIVYCNVR